METEGEYTVLKPERVKKDMELSFSPTGLVVDYGGNNESRYVKVVPDGSSFTVSVKTLREWFEEDVIERK